MLIGTVLTFVVCSFGPFASCGLLTSEGTLEVMLFLFCLVIFIELVYIRREKWIFKIASKCDVRHICGADIKDCYKRTITGDQSCDPIMGPFLFLLSFYLCYHLPLTHSIFVIYDSTVFPFYLHYTSGLFIFLSFLGSYLFTI